MNSQARAQELLDEWRLCAVQTEKAICDRNYRKFRLANRKGQTCCRQINQSIKLGLKDAFLEKQDQVIELTKRWDAIAEAIKPWMAETKDKVERCRTKRQKTKKITKAYGYSKTAGRTVRLKAR